MPSRPFGLSAPARLTALALAATLHGQPAAQPADDGPDVVRVRILAATNVRTATLRAHGGPVVLRADGRMVATLEAGEAVEIRALGERVGVQGSGVDALSSRLEAAAGYGALVGVEAGRTRRRYAGTLRATAEGRRTVGLRLVNIVPTEAYVASVVAGEYPFPEIEGVKAQAVLARTYALHRRGRLGDHDVVDSVMDQVYPGTDASTPLTRRAAEETRGEVLAYGGGLAEIYYSSSNGGYTANNDAVWGRSPLPYLRARPDPYDESPDSRWTARLSARRLHDALGRRFGGNVTGVEVISRSPDGRAHFMRLRGARRDRISGQDFRMLTIEVFGGRVIRSTLFDMHRSGDDYVFEGRGWGHGVGLSQYGARAQARDGRTYRDILGFYFAGASLTPLSGVWRADGGSDLPSGPPAMLDPTTPTDPAEREAMGIRTRPLTRRERAAGARESGSTGARIEERLRDADGRLRPEPPDEDDDERRRTAW